MERHRIDHWLKLVCLYKHRAEATDACNGGHVKLNGNRAKASSLVRENDVVEIGGEHPKKVVVLGLPTGSIAKEIARTMYRDETPPPPPKEDWIDKIAARRDRGAGRPTKKDRRQIEKWNR